MINIKRFELVRGFIDSEALAPRWGAIQVPKEKRRMRKTTLEDVFNGATSGFSVAGAFFGIVAQEIGMERALALYAKACETLGVGMGQMMKEQMGIKELDAKSAIKVAEAIGNNFGVALEAEETPTSVLLTFGRCPVYAANQAVGIDDETKATMCNNGPLKFMDALFKQIDPNVGIRRKKFRASLDDFCVKEVSGYRT